MQCTYTKPYSCTTSSGSPMNLRMSALARSIWPFRIQLINFRPDFEKPRESLHTAIPLVDIVSEESEREEGGERSSENMTDIQEKQQERTVSREMRQKVSKNFFCQAIAKERGSVF